MPDGRTYAREGTEVMKTRPIIFNGEMVQAILDGRKTQTMTCIPSTLLEDSSCPATGSA
jgi:hypothetical protein